MGRLFASKAEDVPLSVPPTRAFTFPVALGTLQLPLRKVSSLRPTIIVPGLVVLSHGTAGVWTHGSGASGLEGCNPFRTIEVEYNHLSSIMLQILLTYLW